MRPTRAQSLTAKVLMLALLLTTASPLLAQQSDEQADAYEQQLTPQEESEARDVAAEFTKRFEASDDVAAIVDDLYVRDFDARLRTNPNTVSYIISIEPQVIPKATDKELRRYYAALLKFIYRYGIIWAAASLREKASGGEERELKLDEVMPPDILAVMETDPTLKKLLEVDRKGDNAGTDEQAAENAGERKSEAEDVMTIATIERLRSYISVIEQLVRLAREHLKRINIPESFATLTEIFRQPDAEIDNDTMNPRVTILKSDTFGCPAGTRLICVNVMAFHIDLIRVDGKLKILNVYLSDD